ncbi:MULTISPECIES: hypothetical protein [Bacillus]|uniref:hypothetical protein n=1 Tax=Bacillus TaxID=1386 RepID=UPI00053A3AD6|nr:hypothetical protein [Bacillus subtilis]AWX23454.1 hypothetical protein CXF51_11950 [Bacillus subtilis subsp. subtilis]MBY0125105.1 hypothetical protein [Bacillus subtilis]MEC1876811.1 hypothetical protein [Bacillus subtilis]MEC1938690.1 hypothetical protein [Bacillus subtilis]MED4613078.1 hypothetical protein [Bacillus subtilis]
MAVKMITVWYKYNDEGSEAKLNHIEDGWINGDYPKPKDPSYSNQEAWKKSSWKRKHAYLDEQYQVLNVPAAYWIKQ